ncbi:MAG TPA: hypothetical protein VIG69_09175 [Candidatus Methylomirabilis sp.]
MPRTAKRAARRPTARRAPARASGNGNGLASRSLVVADALAAIEACYRRGWTDGLPVIPPTEPAIRAMLRGARADPGAVLGELRSQRITAEKVAINAVMAGCLPAHFPIVLAALRGVLDPQFGLLGAAASTQSAATVVIVNGPAARAAGMNARDNVLGPGNRANATIGRAVRLVIQNACGMRPGLLDRGALGTPGRYTCCLAEDEAGSPWPPLHEERGLPRGSSAVTVFAGWGVHQFSDHLSRTAEGILGTAADSMRALGTGNCVGQGECVLLLCPEHRDTIAKDGWDKKAIRGYLFNHARRSLADLKRGNQKPGAVEPGDEEKMIPFARTPDSILVVAAGSVGGRFSAWIPGFTSYNACRAVTVPVE